MKIDPIREGIRSKSTRKRKIEGSGSGAAFRDALHSVANKNQDELDRLYENIDDTGRMLKESPGIDIFKEYREWIREFVRVFLATAYEIKLTSEMTLAGRKKSLLLVRKIDEKLEQMYHLFLQDALDVEKLVAGVDEVRGMLLDLYR